METINSSWEINIIYYSLHSLKKDGLGWHRCWSFLSGFFLLSSIWRTPLSSIGVQGIRCLCFQPTYLSQVRWGFSSLFICDWYGRMEPSPRAIHSWALQGTTDLLCSRTRLLLESQGGHNQRCHSRFSFYHRRLLPSRNHTIYKSPTIKPILTWDITMF